MGKSVGDRLRDGQVDLGQSSKNSASENPAPENPAYEDKTRTAMWKRRELWGALTIYERFEQIISLILNVLISAVIVVAVLQMALRIPALVLSGMIDSGDQAHFQTIFSMILTVLIALEFNHSLMSVLKRKKGVVQVRTVILIALLATVYKFLLMDVTKVAPLTLFGLAAALLALGTVYLLLQGQDE